jgi:menaquinone-9 beta-reductase
MTIHDLVVVGGGPAGSAAAITAARQGARVVLLERGRYPRHKVCGEFVSPESHHLLSSLFVAEDMPLLTSAPRVTRARIFVDGRVIEAPLLPAAISLTRWELDAALWRACEMAGVAARQRVTVDRIVHTAGDMQVETSAGAFTARCIIDATGRWSNLLRLRASPTAPLDKWLGMKAHFAEEDSPDSSDVYFFKGGYCGVQPVGRGTVNVCAMVGGHVCTSLSATFAMNPDLQARSRKWQARSEPVSTFPLIFREPRPESDGVLYAGDAAGFIDPFAGDGISLALASGTAAAAALSGTWRGEYDVKRGAALYRAEYGRRFAPAIRNAALIRRLFQLPIPVRRIAARIASVPSLTRQLVKATRAA